MIDSVVQFILKYEELLIGLFDLLFIAVLVIWILCKSTAWIRERVKNVKDKDGDVL